MEVSVAKLKAGIGYLLTCGLNLTKNSAAKCCASAAEPPLPHKKTFPPFFIFFVIISIAKFISFSINIRDCFTFIDSNIVFFRKGHCLLISNLRK